MPIYKKNCTHSKCTLYSCSENQLYAVKYASYWYVVKTYYKKVCGWTKECRLEKVSINREGR